MSDNIKPAYIAYIAYSVRNFAKEGKPDASWFKVGVAFPHNDGNGFDINLDAVPVTGRAVLRLNEPKPARRAA